MILCADLSCSLGPRGRAGLERGVLTELQRRTVAFAEACDPRESEREDLMLASLLLGWESPSLSSRRARVA